MDKDGNHEHVKTELEKIFPRLKMVGGKFQLFRTIGGGSGKRQLHKVPIGPQGYTTKWLGDDMAVGGACLYIVPFQQLPKSDASEDYKVPIETKRLPQFLNYLSVLYNIHYTKIYNLGTLVQLNFLPLCREREKRERRSAYSNDQCKTSKIN